MSTLRGPHFLMLLLASISLLSSCDFLNAEDGSKSNVIPVADELRCERLPYATLVDRTLSKSSDPCDASSKIQAIAYECGSPEDTDSFQRKAFELNVEKSKSLCDQFCRQQGRSCRGVFESASDCGLKTPPSRALDFGKNVMKCPTKCKGQAFNYCSIYHGNFLATDDPQLFKNARSNCRCTSN